MLKVKVNRLVNNSLQLVNFTKGINNSTYQTHSVTVFYATALCIISQENKGKRYEGTEGRREEGTKRRKICIGEIISFSCKFQAQSHLPLVSRAVVFVSSRNAPRCVA